MSLRERRCEWLTDTLTLVVVELGVRTVYEVVCEECGAVDQYDQRGAAETYGPQHECEATS